MLSDIEIAQASKMKDIVDVAADLGIEATELESYGRYKAKVSDSVMNRLKDKPDGKLILVTAINPTPAGEGKTTTTVGLGQALNKVGKKAIIALREPSLGPVFGVKGGAAGGGYSQVVPMEDINLHFTGDMHAITTANNLLSCAIDNHIHQGNDLKIDLRRLMWKRVLDMNDRALRDVVVSLGGKPNGFPRQDGFLITVASEIMAILCLSNDITDLKARLGKIFIGYSLDNKPIYCKDLQVDGAMAALLKDAIKPNLVQTLENTPAFVHGGPFANIAHGCNSVRATKLALKLADYCVTEAGFGSDLGAEKFFDIKCRAAGLTPAAVVVVATARALKYNAGVSKADAGNPNPEALKKGLVNLEAHIDNMKNFGVPTIIAVNVFAADTQEELDLIADCCKRNGAEFAISNVFAKGGEGGIELAEKVIATIENKPTKYAPLYNLDLPLKDKMNAIATKVYGADGVVYSADAEKKIAEAESLGLAGLPICVAKTQYSLTDDQTKLGRPKGFEITVKDIRFSVGAGFIVFLTGDIMTMPGLPKVPAANKIDIDADGVITGLF